MAGGKHVELLQTGDGLCLDQRVRMVLHDGTANQTVHPGRGYSTTVTCIRHTHTPLDTLNISNRQTF